MNSVADLTQSYILQEKARAFTNWAAALAVSKGNIDHAISSFESRNPRSKHLDTIRKAAIDIGLPQAGNWAGPLGGAQGLGGAFLDFIRPRTVLGRLLGVQTVPFNVMMSTQTSGFAVGWAGAGKPILVSKGEFERFQMGKSKIGGIVVISQELAESLDEKSQQAINRDLVNATVQFSDEQLLDPAISEDPNVSPASITHGALTVTSTGTTAAQVETDLTAMVSAMVNGGVGLVSPFWVMKPTTALALAKLRGSGGERIFPDVGPLGGSILTIPVITSVGAGPRITLIDASQILVAEDGIELTVSKEATVQLDSDPADESTSFISLFQLNLVALLIIRYIRWVRAHDAAVVYMTVAY